MWRDRCRRVWLSSVVPCGGCATVQKYCSFGSAELLDQLDNSRMGKLARDTGIIGTFARAVGDVDVTFAKVRLAAPCACLHGLVFALSTTLIIVRAGQGRRRAEDQLRPVQATAAAAWCVMALVIRRAARRARPSCRQVASIVLSPCAVCVLPVQLSTPSPISRPRLGTPTLWT